MFWCNIGFWMIKIKKKLWLFEDYANNELKCRIRTPFRYCRTHFWSTYWSSNYAYHISFQRLGSQESNASNGAWFGVETKKLWLFKDEPRNHASKEAESPLTEITHEASHSISDLLKPSDQIDPTESSSWGDYAT